MFRINKLALAVEKANNVRIRNNGEQSTLTELHEYALTVEGHLLQYLDEVKAARQDSLLSEAGKLKRIGELKDGIVAKLAGLDRSAKLSSKLERMQADLAGRVASTRKQNESSDKTIALLQGNEIRQYLQALRQEAKQQHERYVAQAVKEGRALSDQERTFHDPVQALYLEACGTYSPGKEPFLAAVTGAPWPLTMLPAETIQQGEQLLQQAIAPDLHNAIRHHTISAAMDQVFMEGIASIIAAPEAVAVMQTPHIARPDKKGA